MLKRAMLVIFTILGLLMVLFAAPMQADDESDDSGAKINSITEIEMSTYVLAFLRRGPAWTAEETAATVKLSEGHLANITRLANEGKLALAGPFMDPTDAGDLAGLFLFRTESIDSARAWSQSDPAVQAGRFTMEYHLWYGPKNLSYK